MKWLWSRELKCSAPDQRVSVTAGLRSLFYDSKCKVENRMGQPVGRGSLWWGENLPGEGTIQGVLGVLKVLRWGRVHFLQLPPLPTEEGFWMNINYVTILKPWVEVDSSFIQLGTKRVTRGLRSPVSAVNWQSARS